ncbi:MAG TPA: hypothetical protein VN844_03955 [Pyrinomonadaceae bacterium]|nr:hypothetical protein [Pyrinomonadaceae bacterium]
MRSPVEREAVGELRRALHDSHGRGTVKHLPNTRSAVTSIRNETMAVIHVPLESD